MRLSENKIPIIIGMPALIPILFYAINPLGTATWDPRMRLFGYAP